MAILKQSLPVMVAELMGSGQTAINPALKAVQVGLQR